MNVLVHPDADAELASAVEWYEAHRSGLGDELERDVFDAFEAIAEHPRTWPSWPELPEVRVYGLDRFPYLIPYMLRGNDAAVLAGRACEAAAGVSAGAGGAVGLTRTSGR